MNHFPFLIEREILRRKITLFNSNWILGRVACLGLELFNRSFSGNIYKLINTQKGRVDCLSDYAYGKEKKPYSRDIFDYLKRHDIASLIVQQQIFSLPNKSPKYILMDSYSELTDQKFISIEDRYAFCCNYSDLNFDKKAKMLFRCEGLLSIAELERHYTIFFDMLINTYGNVPIIFIHFPSELESREKFKNRADRILVAISKVQKKYNRFHQVIVSPSTALLVDEGGDSDFPYHYNESVYADMEKQINKIICLYDK
jgi:hypothetical protein